MSRNLVFCFFVRIIYKVLSINKYFLLYIATVKEVSTFLLPESLDVEVGLLKLLLVIEYICKPAPIWFLFSTWLYFHKSEKAKAY